MPDNPHVMSKYATEAECVHEREQWWKERVASLESENAALRDQVEALKKDAERMKVAEEALDHISRLCKKQLDLIADRATGEYIDKLPVVRAINQHKHYADAAIAKIKEAS